MRLNEIIGDSESDVYEQLRNFLFILDIVPTLDTISPALAALIVQYATELYEDRVNLDFYILSSERIASAYAAIQFHLTSERLSKIIKTKL